MGAVRLTREARKNIIIQAGVRVALAGSIMDVNSFTVAEACSVETSDATVRQYFHTVEELRNAVCDAHDDVRSLSDAAGFGYGS